MEQQSSFTVTVLGLVGVAVTLFVLIENRHRRKQAEEDAAEQRRLARQRDILDANEKHVAEVIALHTNKKEPAT